MNEPAPDNCVFVLVEVGDTNDGADCVCHGAFKALEHARDHMRKLYDKAIQDLQNDDVQIDGDASYFCANVAHITTDHTPPECWSWHILESFKR